MLENHRTPLETWATAADLAVKRTAGLATVRGTAQIAREQLAEDLTRERDGLHDALSARARDRSLPREWPDQFFKKATRAEPAREESEEGEPSEEAAAKKKPSR